MKTTTITKSLPKKEQQTNKKRREETAKINEATFPPNKKKRSSPNKANEKQKAGRVTRVVQNISEEAKEKALRAASAAKEAALNAKDDNQLSVFISVQVGACHYRLERAKYDTPEKLEEFKERKRAQQHDWLVERVKKLRKGAYNT